MTNNEPRTTAVRLTINADDLGFTAGVNRGILACHEAGTLPSASMMVTTPGFGDACALVRDRMPRLGIGLHLNLVQGRSLTAAPSLTDAAGNFLPLGALARRALGGGVVAREVRAECDAQLAALAAAGISPTHFDGHRHAHILPGVLSAVVASARAAGVRVVRRPLDRPVPSDPAAAARMLVLRGVWRTAQRALSGDDRRWLGAMPRFRGVALQGRADVGSRLLALLERLPREVPAGAHVEIMMHPGYGDAELAGLDPYVEARDAEVRALCSAQVGESLARFALTPF